MKLLLVVLILSFIGCVRANGRETNDGLTEFSPRPDVRCYMVHGFTDSFQCVTIGGSNGE